jgi:hypothetical protein
MDDEKKGNVYTVYLKNCRNSHGLEEDYYLRVTRSLIDLEKDQAIVKDVLFAENQGDLEETVKELTNFVLRGAFLYTNPSIMWKVLNFKVKPGDELVNDPLFLALESNIILEIERLKIDYASDIGGLYLKELVSFWEKNKF